MNPLTTRPDRVDAPLYVVTSITNPWRYRSRWALYHDFARRIEDMGAKLVTVEVAYGDRAFAVTSADRGSSHVQLRTESELWHKENALNIGFSRLPSDWKYAAWIDADVTFVRPDIVEATIQALQHWPVVQMWSRGLDLAPNGHPFAQYCGFADCYLHSRVRRPDPNESAGDAAASGLVYACGSATSRGYWHSGYAWAIRREAFNAIGGLIDFAPLGAADYFMAWGLVRELSGRIYRQIKDRARARRGYSAGYVEALVEWERKAQALRNNVGCVEGLLVHHWHGKKRRRGYNVRENVLIDHEFNPCTDLRRDWQGLWQLHDDGSERAARLRDHMRAYFRSRDEDSTEHDGAELF